MQPPNIGCTPPPESFGQDQKSKSNPIRYHQMTMRLLRYIAAGFINFFSITQPPPEAENRAALYIAAMLLAVLAFVAIVITFAAHIFSK
ncbi:hypothetical protein [Granulicella sp. dw_53]|uniref:hypothetical protein n=1 Tax=Granulicella sp. dw_53 TaxID=2719792 RepID=UPI001BD43F4F|nr:hypothetical protein [Granulicella sp. dw_53]